MKIGGELLMMKKSLNLALFLFIFAGLALPLEAIKPDEIPVFSFNVGSTGDTGKLINKNIRDLEGALVADKASYEKLYRFLQETYGVQSKTSSPLNDLLKDVKPKDAKTEDSILRKIGDIYAKSNEVMDILRKFPSQGFLFFGTIASREEAESFNSKIDSYRTNRLKVLLNNITNLYPNAIILFQELFAERLDNDVLTLVNASDKSSDVAIAYSPKYYDIKIAKRDPTGAFLLLNFKSLLDKSLPEFSVATIHAAGCDPNVPEPFGGGKTDADDGNQSLDALLVNTKDMKNVILMGDFNVTKKHPRFKIPEKYGFREAVKGKEADSDTAYTLKLDGTHKIDHAFYKTNFPGLIRSMWAKTDIYPLYSDEETKRAGIEEIEGKKPTIPYANPYGLSGNLNFSPSDHRPVLVVFKLHGK